MTLIIVNTLCQKRNATPGFLVMFISFSICCYTCIIKDNAMKFEMVKLMSAWHKVTVYIGQYRTLDLN